MTILLTDLYQLTMLEAYLAEGLDDEAVFELFVRRLPPSRNLLVAAGLEQALDLLETLAFRDDEIAWLASRGDFSARLLDALKGWRFTGDVDAMPEGTPFFADEPVLRVRAPLPQAQLVESRLLNLVHFQTLIASKAARVVLAAPHALLVDFGMRRAHGAEAALLAARAAYLAGFDGTATVEAGRRFGIPLYGTMAHSFVQAHASEAAAFEAFVRARPAGATLLVDTYDTATAVDRVAALARRLAPEGLRVAAIRIDSGDLEAQARQARRQLDAAGCPDIRIFTSGDLDESRIARLVAAGAPIDGYGVGTALDVSTDAPALDAVYKLQACGGRPCRKRSPGKATWPGAKQVCRVSDDDGMPLHDVVQLADEAPVGTPLLQPVMRGGRRLAPAPPLARLREQHAQSMAALPATLRALAPARPPYRVDVSPALRALAARLDAATV